jgi:hypothetical protein
MLASSTQPQYGMSNIHTALCCWPKTVDAWPAVTSQRFCLEKQGFRGTPFKTEKPYSAFVSILMKAACPLIASVTSAAASLATSAILVSRFLASEAMFPSVTMLLATLAT